MKVAEESDSAMAKDFHIILDQYDEQKVPYYNYAAIHVAIALRLYPPPPPKSASPFLSCTQITLLAKGVRILVSL